MTPKIESTSPDRSNIIIPINDKKIIIEGIKEYSPFWGRLFKRIGSASSIQGESGMRYFDTNSFLEQIITSWNKSEDDDHYRAPKPSKQVRAKLEKHENVQLVAAELKRHHDFSKLNISNISAVYCLLLSNIPKQIFIKKPDLTTLFLSKINSLFNRCVSWIRAGHSKATQLFQSIFKIDLISRLTQSCPPVEKREGLEGSWMDDSNLWIQMDKLSELEDKAQFGDSALHKTETNRNDITFNEDKEPIHFDGPAVSARILSELTALLPDASQETIQRLRFGIEHFVDQKLWLSPLGNEMVRQYYEKGFEFKESKSSWHIDTTGGKSQKITLITDEYRSIIQREDRTHVLGYDSYRCTVTINLEAARDPDWLLTPGCVEIKTEQHGFSKEPLLKT